MQVKAMQSELQCTPMLRRCGLNRAILSCGTFPYCPASQGSGIPIYLYIDSAHQVRHAATAPGTPIAACPLPAPLCPAALALLSRRGGPALCATKQPPTPPHGRAGPWPATGRSNGPRSGRRVAFLNGRGWGVAPGQLARPAGRPAPARGTGPVLLRPGGF